MLFKTLMGKYLDESIKEDVLKLLDLKMNFPEIAEGPRFDKVNAYMEENMIKTEEQIKTLPFKHEKSWSKLNSLFVDLLKSNH